MSEWGGMGRVGRSTVMEKLYQQAHPQQYLQPKRQNIKLWISWLQVAEKSKDPLWRNCLIPNLKEFSQVTFLGQEVTQLKKKKSKHTRTKASWVRSGRNKESQVPGVHLEPPRPIAEEPDRPHLTTPRHFAPKKNRPLKQRIISNNQIHIGWLTGSLVPWNLKLLEN